MPPQARPLARLAVGWAALSELVPYYPLYALLFLDTGLTGAQISALFAVWSVTGLVCEVPAGVLADRWSRRGAVVLASVLQAAAFAVWTAAPQFAAFAVGFVVWGVGGALVSGASEALVYDGLVAAGAGEHFARVNGAMTAAELVVQVPTALAAGALFAVGGYPLVGWASVGACLAAAALALRFPEAPRPAPDDDDPDDPDDDAPGGFRGALAEVRASARLRLLLLAVALVGGLDAVEEYFPVLAGQWGVPTEAVPAAVLVVSLAGAAGAALGGRAGRLPSGALVGALAVGGLLLGAAALWARPAALAAVALFYGLYLAVLVVAEARLQDRIGGTHRATVTSVAGLGIELAALLVFAAWAVAGAAGVAVLVLAVAPVVRAGLGARSEEPDPRPRGA